MSQHEDVKRMHSHTLSGKVMALDAIPSFLERGVPPPVRILTRFAAEAIQLLLWVPDLRDNGVDIRFRSLPAFRLFCLDEERVGDMKCGGFSLADWWLCSFVIECKAIMVPAGR